MARVWAYLGGFTPRLRGFLETFLVGVWVGDPVAVGWVFEFGPVRTHTDSVAPCVTPSWPQYFGLRDGWPRTAGSQPNPAGADLAFGRPRGSVGSVDFGGRRVHGLRVPAKHCLQIDGSGFDLVGAWRNCVGRLRVSRSIALL